MNVHLVITYLGYSLTDIWQSVSLALGWCRGCCLACMQNKRLEEEDLKLK